MQDYVVWRVLDHAVDWFVLRDGTYVRAEPGTDGLIRGSAFPGLWLDGAAEAYRMIEPILKSAARTGLLDVKLAVRE